MNVCWRVSKSRQPINHAERLEDCQWPQCIQRLPSPSRGFAYDYSIKPKHAWMCNLRRWVSEDSGQYSHGSQKWCHMQPPLDSCRNLVSYSNEVITQLNHDWTSHDSRRCPEIDGCYISVGECPITERDDIICCFVRTTLWSRGGRSHDLLLRDVVLQIIN